MKAEDLDSLDLRKAKQPRKQGKNTIIPILEFQRFELTLLKQNKKNSLSKRNSKKIKYRKRLKKNLMNIKKL